MADELTLKDIFDIEGLEIGIFGKTAAIIDAGDGDVYQWFDADLLTSKEGMPSLASELFSEEEEDFYCDNYIKETGKRPDISKIRPFTKEEFEGFRRTDVVLATKVNDYYGNADTTVVMISTPEPDKNNITYVSENLICGWLTSDCPCTSFCLVKDQNKDRYFCFLGVDGYNENSVEIENILSFIDNLSEDIDMWRLIGYPLKTYGFEGFKTFINPEQTALFADEMLKAAKEFEKIKKKEDIER